MPFNPLACILVVLDFFVLLAFVFVPMRRKYDDSDKGEASHVVLPPVQRATLWRVLRFVLTGAAVCLVIVGLRNPNLTDVYRNLVSLITQYVVRAPSTVNPYVKTLRPVIPISVVGFVIALAATVSATWGRRLVIVLNGLLFLAISVLSDCILAIFALETGLPLGPFPIISILVHYSLAFAMGLRLAFTTYQLPRPTHVPLFRRGRYNFADSGVLILAVVASLTLVGAAAVRLAPLVGSTPAVLLLLLVAVPTYAKYGLYSILCLIGLSGGRSRRPDPGPERPPLNVIAPAFNESENIVRWVRAIDMAAKRYGGPVHIYLCDDGSTDGTKELAEAAMQKLVAASGEVIEGGHAGKSTALNNALGRCTADYVVRIDTDCAVDEEAFVYTVPWFLKHPDVGVVGAFVLPKRPLTTWIDRMRCFEVGSGFGMPRVAWPVIDGTPCVPGTYAAFRRKPALEVGGFTEGIYGEDIDFTCNLARLGYRAVYDRRVWSYEDVPNTIPQLRLQRLRWNRGGIQNYARFVPLASGFGGPRFWFTAFIRTGRRIASPLHVIVLVYAIEASFFDASAHANIARLALVYILARVPTIVFTIFSMFYWRLWRTLLWLPLIFAFAIVKLTANIEAVLTFPCRPVHLALRRRFGFPDPSPNMPVPVVAGPS